MTTKHDDMKLSNEKMKLAQMLQELVNLNVQCTSIDAIANSMPHIRTAISVMKSVQANSHSPKLSTVPCKRVAPNSNNEKQLRFYSTAKRRKVSSRWAKPTGAEVEKCQEDLMNIEAKVCGICYKEDDLNTCLQEVDWIQCENCNLWVHLHCVSATMLSSESSSGYQCKYCM